MKKRKSRGRGSRTVQLPLKLLHRPDKGFRALFEDMKRKTLEDAVVAALQRGDLEDWGDPAARKKRRAAAMSRAVAERADELRRQGVGNPVTEARKEIAKRYGVQSGDALYKRLYRSGTRTKSSR